VAALDRRLVLIGGALLAAGLANEARTQPAIAPLSPPTPPSLEELEPVYAVTATPQGLTIRVGSKGCTRKADFAFMLERRLDSASVAFGRKPVAACKGGGAGRTDLTFSYDELGVAANSTLFVLNPLAVPAAPPPRPSQAGHRSARGQAHRRRR
jgi:hypothetical protein